MSAGTSKRPRGGLDAAQIETEADHRFIAFGYRASDRRDCRVSGTRARPAAAGRDAAKR
jgi:hypothetical protein